MPPSIESDLLSTCGEAFRAHLITDGLTRLRGTRIVVRAISDGTARTLAATSSDGLTIILSPKLARQPLDVRRGIVMHELGHAVDFLYPATIVLGRGTERDDLVVDADRDPTRRELARWKRRGHDDVERFADSIAERAFGVTIGYRGPCLLQSDKAGVRPRPRGLR